MNCPTKNACKAILRGLVGSSEKIQRARMTQNIEVTPYDPNNPRIEILPHHGYK